MFGTTKEQLVKQQEENQGQYAAPGRDRQSRAGLALQHAHHPGPGPIIGQRGNACHIAHDVVDVHGSNRSSSEVGFEI